MDGSSMHGYLRPDGKIGIRNSIAVIYTCLQVRHVAEQIAQGISRAEVFGFRENSGTIQIPLIMELSKHPNIVAAIIVGLDDEDEAASQLADEISKTGKPTALIQVLSDGGTVKAALKGIRVGSVLARQADDGQRIPVSLADLVIGVVYDDPAGTANAAYPAIEWVIRWITARRGTVIGCRLPDDLTIKETLSFGQKPSTAGLYQLENSSFSTLLASGAHLIVLVSGKGSVTGSIVAQSEVGGKLIDILAAAGIIASKSEGRRLIQQGGLYLGDTKVTDVDIALTADLLENNSVLVRKGKKTYHRIVVE